MKYVTVVNELVERSIHLAIEDNRIFLAQLLGMAYLEAKAAPARRAAKPPEIARAEKDVPRTAPLVRIRRLHTADRESA